MPGLTEDLAGRARGGTYAIFNFKFPRMVDSAYEAIRRHVKSLFIGGLAFRRGPPTRPANWSFRSHRLVWAGAPHFPNDSKSDGSQVASKRPPCKPPDDRLFATTGYDCAALLRGALPCRSGLRRPHPRRRSGATGTSQFVRTRSRRARPRKLGIRLCRSRWLQTRFRSLSTVRSSTTWASVATQQSRRSRSRVPFRVAVSRIEACIMRCTLGRSCCWRTRSTR